MNFSENNIKKLYYISPRDMRKNRADAVHIMYSCAAFSNNGIDVELIAPKVNRTNYDLGSCDIFSLYDVPENFKITELNTRINEVDNKSTATTLAFNRFTFNLIFILQHLSTFRNKNILVYSKCYTSIIPYILLKSVGVIRCKLVFETPFLKDNTYHKFIMKRMNAVVTMTSYVEDFLLNTFKVPREKVIKCPIRFQTDYQNDTAFSKEENREELNWNPKYKYIVYAGKAGERSKRLQNFAEASNTITNTKFVIVGATKGLIKRYKSANYKNLYLYPFQTYPEYLKFVQAADILVATYEDTIYNRYALSPGKGGAYLQSENPVIFTDFPCLRHRFPDNMVSFVKPDDTEDLIINIKEILDDYDAFKIKAKKASVYASSQTFTDASRYLLIELNNTIFS